MQGEKKFEITLSHKLTGFFTQDGDYIEALKVVGKSASDATQLEAAKNYLIDNNLFAKHPNLLGLNDICSNFLGYEFDESDPKRIAEAFRKPEFVKALQADKTLLEIFNSEDSQVEAAKLFVMTAPGLNIVFFVALSGNPQFVEDFISRVESSGALKGKFDISTHYTEHKLNLLFCATLLRSPQLLANFLDKKIDLNHKIKNHDQYYTLLQMMLFFYNNAEMLKTLKEKLHPETYSALINNITLEPMNSGITQTDLLSFALESDLLKGKDKALIDLVDFCSRDIKVSDTLLGLINTKLSGETKTAVTEKLKPAKAAEEEHQQQNASTGNGSGLLDDEPVDEAHQEQPLQNASVGNGSGILTDEPVDEAHQEQPLQNASARDPSDLLADEPEDVVHQEQPLQNASGRETSGLLTDEPEDVAHQEQRSQNASAREPSGLLTEEPVDPEHQEQRSQNASAREPSGLLTEEPVDPEHQEQRSQIASAREPSSLLTEEPVDPEHQEQRPQNASAREPSGLLTEEPVDPEHQEQRPQNASAREPSGLLTEEPVDPEHQEQRPQNASAREPSGLLTEEPEDEQNDDGAEEGDEEEFDNEEDSLENEHAPYQTQIATRVATPPRELVRQELELQFLLSAAQQKGLQTQSQRLNQALDFQVHHDPQPFSPAPKTPVKPSPARRSKTRATIKHDFTLTEKSLEWQLMEACLELLDKPVKAKIDESDDPAGKTVNSVKLNYAKHFNFLVTKDQNRAEKLLQRLIQIRTEKPRPKLSTADYIYIIAGNPNDFAFRNNLSALKSNLTVISDGSDSDSVKKLQIKTSDNRTAILYAYNFIEEGINCKFDAVIPLSTFLTSKDFLQKTLRDQSGRTVLHWAAIGGSFSMLDTLATGLNTLRRNLPTLTDSFPQFSSTDHRNNSVAHEIARSELYQIRVNTSATHELIVQRSHLRFNHNASYDIIELTRDNLDSLTSDEHIDFFSTRNQDGDLPFQLVVSHNFTALLGILLNDPNAPILNIDRDLHGTNGSSTNVSILHYAAMCPEVLWTTASIIIQQKPRLVHTPDAQGYMPLHYASAACNVPTQLLLLAKGARPSAKSQTGDSPLTLALSAYTFDDETLDSTGKIPLHMSTLIRGFNDIAERRLTKCEHEPLDYNSRYITSDELDSLDEILGNEAIMNLFTPAEKQRLQLASLQRLYENLSKEKYIRRPVSEEKEHSKVATRMREYALLPVAIFQARGVEFGEKEKAAAYYNPRGLQVIRSSQYYSAFFTSKAFPIPEKQKKEFLIEYGFEKNSDIKLEDINQTLVEATEGFKVLLIRSISAWDQPWVKTVPQRTNGHRIPSWGQWWNDRFGDTTYKNIAIKILDKVEVLLKKVEYVKTQLDARTMHENTAAELNSKYKAELLTLIDDALRKADKQMQHVDKSTSDPALSDFRARCMVAKVIATKVDIVSATVARELNF